MPYRIFLSGVSSEFESARNSVADGLQAKGLEVRVERSFSQGEQAGTLLRRLDDYIRQCDAVICLIGAHSGSYPPATAEFMPKEMLPAGFDTASYTQWEFHFARYYRKRLHIFFAGPGWQADRRPAEKADLIQQQQFVQYVKGLNLYRCSVDSPDQLCAKVFLESWPDLTKSKPNNLPSASLGSLFKGRERFLKDLRDSFTEAAARTAKVVYGTGGLGKTRAAIEYAWQYADKYNALLFLSADTPATLLSSLAKLVDVLKLEGMEGASDDVRLAAVYNWLELHPGWLAILDNVDTDEAARAAREQLARLAQGHVLITSRRTHWSSAVEKLELDVLEKGAAIEYLQEAADQRYVTPDDAWGGAAVAMKVGRLALGLEHAAAYINVRGWSFAKYVSLWEDNEDAILAEFDSDSIDYPRELLVTWKLSVDRLDADARTLLEVLSWFAPEPIPQSIFDSLSANCLTRAPDVALNLLVGYSLIERQNLDGERYFQVHRLVQATTRYHQRHSSSSAGSDLPSLESALHWMDCAYQGDPQNVNDWPKLEPLVEHVLSIYHFAELAHKTSANHAIARLLDEVGVLFYEKARYAQAEPLMRRALAIDEHCFGTEHPTVAHRLNSLAWLLKAKNRLAEAEPLMLRALAIDKQYYGAEQPEVAIRLNNLALLLKDMNRSTEAEKLMREALFIDERASGPKDSRIVVDLNNLALLLKDMNRLAEAEQLMRRALAIDEKAYGTEDPRIVTALDSLAWLLKDMDQPEEAEQLMRRALAIDERAYGTEDPRIVRQINSLAWLLKDIHHREEAEQLMRRALAIDMDFYGTEHPMVATALNSLAWLLKDMNRMSEAEQLMRDALKIDEQTYGGDHPDVARDLNNLVHLFQATNRLEEAEPLMRRYVCFFAKSERENGHEHPHMQTAMQKYRELLDALGIAQDEVARRVREACSDTDSPARA